MDFLYVKIPVDRRSRDRLHRREDAVDQALRDAGLGSVAGWGDSLQADEPVGARSVAYTRVDVDVVDLAGARALLRAALASIGVPADTQIHYTIDHRRLEDRWDGARWQLEQPVVEPHVHR